MASFSESNGLIRRETMTIPTLSITPSPGLNRWLRSTAPRTARRVSTSQLRADLGRLLDASGKVWFRLDEQRRDVRFDQISTHLKDAVIAIEDHRYYSHPGVDPILAVAAEARVPVVICAGHGVPGGSR